MRDVSVLQRDADLHMGVSRSLNSTTVRFRHPSSRMTVVQGAPRVYLRPSPSRSDRPRPQTNTQKVLICRENNGGALDRQIAGDCALAA